MSVTRKDVEVFFRTLLLGDIEEEQNLAGQVVGGLISLIPVLGQVMAVRDLSGTLMHISRQGGFANATPEQVVNFGFAAFGAIPEAGSVFKTVFKPLWKERRAAQGVVRGGATAIEAMLGMNKGGAVRWVKTMDWASYSRNAAGAANTGLDACIDLTEFIASARGWKGWLIPESVQSMAADMLPPLKGLRGGLDEPIDRATREIRAFVEDLLGEQAAAVAMAVGERAVQASATPGSRSRAGHNAADRKAGKAPERQEHKKLQDKPRVEASQGQGPVHTGTRTTRRELPDISNAAAGISGEHIADYICAQKFGWGVDWKGHDDGSDGQWTQGTPGKEKLGKLSKGGSPKARGVLYKLTDGANGTGIDAVWRAEGHNHGKRYAIVEAKATKNEDGPKFARDPRSTRQPSIKSTLGVNGIGSPEELIEPLGDSGAENKPGGKPAGKPGGKPQTGAPSRKPQKKPTGSDTSPGKKDDALPTVLVQMSHEWINANLDAAVKNLAGDIRTWGYSRHLFFSPAYHTSGSPAEHMMARAKRTGPETHSNHDAYHYDDGEVKKAVNNRKKSLRAKYGNHPNLKDET